MTDIQPLINELVKLLVPSIVEHLDINGYKFSDVTTDELAEAINDYCENGHLDQRVMNTVEEQVVQCIHDGSVDDDLQSRARGIIEEGCLDDEINDRINQCISNGSFDVEVTFNGSW